MTITYEIEKYKLIYYGKRDSESNEIAKILFYNDQSQIIGWMRFFKEGQTIQDNSNRTNIDPARVYLTASENQMSEVVDMLRNEKPCYVRYHSSIWAYIYTGSEPIGEEESE